MGGGAARFRRACGHSSGADPPPRSFSTLHTHSHSHTHTHTLSHTHSHTHTHTLHRCPAGANCSKTIILTLPPSPDARADSAPAERPATATTGRRLTTAATPLSLSLLPLHLRPRTRGLVEVGQGTVTGEVSKRVGTQWPLEESSYWVGPVRSSVYDSEACTSLRDAAKDGACPDGSQWNNGGVCTPIAASVATDNLLFECFEGAEFYECRTPLACPGGGSFATYGRLDVAGSASNSSCRAHHIGPLCDMWYVTGACVWHRACVAWACVACVASMALWHRLMGRQLCARGRSHWKEQQMGAVHIATQLAVCGATDPSLCVYWAAALRVRVPLRVAGGWRLVVGAWWLALGGWWVHFVCLVYVTASLASSCPTPACARSAAT